MRSFSTFDALEYGREFTDQEYMRYYGNTPYNPYETDAGSMTISSSSQQSDLSGLELSFNVLNFGDIRQNFNSTNQRSGTGASGRQSGPYPSGALNQGHFFRLMKLLPGIGDESIRVKLYHNRVEDQIGSYEAISYAWGGSNDKEWIFVNDQDFEIKRNLYNALKELRHPRRKRLLWADGICIDQENDDEKGHQVNIMNLIFGSAKGVLAWLGNAFTDDTNVALDFVGSTVVQCCANLGYLESCPNIRVALKNVSLPSESQIKKHLKAINSVIRNEYFQRVWILQEVALAQEVTILCGAFSISLTILMIFCKIVSLSKASPSIPLSGRLNSRFDNIWSTFQDSNPTWIITNPILYQLATISANSDHTYGHIQDFASVLSATAGLGASNDPDYLFALLGHRLAKSTETKEPLLMADLSKPLASLNHGLAARLCNVEHSLSHLRAVFHANSESIMATFPPSWVPRWGDSPPPNPQLVRGFSDPNFSSHGIYNPQMYAIRNILHAPGLEIDTIAAEISPAFAKRNSGSPETHMNNKNLFITSWGRLFLEYNVPIEDLVCLFICHGYTSFADSEFSGVLDLLKVFDDRHFPYIHSAIRHRWGSDIERLEADGKKGSMKSFWERIFKHFATRKFFVTSKGYVGLGPEMVQEGDVCSALFGSEAILILRSVQAGQHKVVGGCTIAGLMEGEISQGWNRGDLQERSFTLS